MAACAGRAAGVWSSRQRLVRARPGAILHRGPRSAAAWRQAALVPLASRAAAPFSTTYTAGPACPECSSAARQGARGSPLMLPLCVGPRQGVSLERGLPLRRLLAQRRWCALWRA